MFEIILGVLLLIMGLFVIVAITDAKHPFLSFSAYFFMIIGIVLILEYNKSEPTAIEVYQGKTTLEITYKDGVPVDSVVVYRNEQF